MHLFLGTPPEVEERHVVTRSVCLCACLLVYSTEKAATGEPKRIMKIHNET